MPLALRPLRRSCSTGEGRASIAYDQQMAQHLNLAPSGGAEPGSKIFLLGSLII